MNISNQITVVIVLYNSSNLIFDCLNSLNKFSIILVDNGKNLHLLEKLQKRKNIKIISKNKNLGYGKAVNFAFELINGKSTKLDSTKNFNENEIKFLTYSNKIKPEIDLCRKFLRKNLSIIVNPLSIAHHKQGSSSKFNLNNFFKRCYHNEISPLYYFNIKKNSPHVYKNMIKYLFRFISYLLIFNFKNSIKNGSKLLANIAYLIK